uniref:7TM_GPCR_Srx domain-containing protein n=2 Tax=Caenorhabditis tropicalis TaxID=1561998 RepID=A0A1I7TWE1_9PELO
MTPYQYSNSNTVGVFLIFVSIHSFRCFTISNMIMTVSFTASRADKMMNIVAQYSYQCICVPVFVYVATIYVYPFTAPGDGWLYNFYSNSIMAVCALEIYTLATDKVWLQNVGKKIVEEESEQEDSEFSDDDWENVENETAVF